MRLRVWWCSFTLAVISAGPSAHAATLTLTCAPDKSAPCGGPWLFDEPSATTTCFDAYTSLMIVNTVTNPGCPRTMVRTWQATDNCGNTSLCSQVVTLVDTSPPAALCSGINLVPNPDFENKVGCPSFVSQLNLAAPWFNPSAATPDYYHPCATFPAVQVPTNFGGYQQPFSGQAYAGAFVYSETGGNDPNASYREYIEAPLLAPLVSGQAYRVSFRVSLAETSGWAIAEIGAHFSSAPATAGGQGVIAAVPQIVNPATNLLDSTTAWTLIQGVYTATGGESYVTIGNFLTDAATTASTAPVPTNSYAYYFYDAVEVVALCAPEVTNKTALCGSPWTFDPPRAVDACVGTSVLVTVASTVTNGLCPPVITRTWTLTDTCGNTGSWQQTVTVFDVTPPVVNCACLQDAALPLLYTNGCSGTVPSLAPFTNCASDNCGPVTITQLPLAGTVVGAGLHTITATVTDCSGNGTVCTVPFFVDPPVPLLVCPTNLVVLTCSNSAVVSFAPQASGHTGPIVCSPPSGSAFPLGTNLVTCTATSSCGGIATCSFTVTVKPAHWKWGCLRMALYVPANPMGTARVVARPDFPGGVLGLDLTNLGSSGADGLRLDPGASDAFAFSTVLDFDAAARARIDLTVPPDAADTNGSTLVYFEKAAGTSRTWNVIRPCKPDESPVFVTSIAVATNGELRSSFTATAGELATGIVARIRPGPGVTQVVVRIEIDQRKRDVCLGYVDGDVTWDAARKGWDGLIYGNGPRGTRTNKAARLFVSSPDAPALPPITNLELRTTGLAQLAFDDPAIETMRRPWREGHVTVLKARDDGGGGAIEFSTLASGGGLHTELGHAADFSLRLTRADGGNVPFQEDFWDIIDTLISAGGPPTTNVVRVAQGPVGVECFVAAGDPAVTNVTVQLWNGALLVSERARVPASLAAAVATVSEFPSRFGRAAANNAWTLYWTNTVAVFSGLDCSGACLGTELRILSEIPPTASPPVAFTALACRVGDGQDLTLSELQITPACATTNPVHIATTPGGTTVSWTGDGFRLQGAETPAGPWYDLGVASPVHLAAGSPLRVFRLICD